jgi:LDH2 family malate/lactate/ureidoglycolate dehydrogenase
MNTIPFRPAHLRLWTAGVFRRLGVPPRSARTAAAVLSYADLHGFDTHGLANLESIYVRQIESGRINPQAEPEVVRRHGAVAVVNGHDGLGLVTATRAMDLAIARAARFGVAAVAVRRSSHFGAAGFYASRALRRHMIGLATTNLGGQAIVRPPGGGRPLLGTNPLSLAAPADRLPPFVLDMSTTAAASGKIRQALRRGQPVPDGWLADDAGRTVTDPSAYFAGTAHLRFPGEYRGYGLSVLAEILCGVLSGAAVGTDTAGEHDVGHFFLALNVGAFRPTGFGQRMDDLLGALLDCPPLPGREPVRYAGHGRARRRQERRANGVPLDAELVESLRALGRRLELPFPVSAVRPTRSAALTSGDQP